MMMTATMKEARSLAGSENHTPSRPHSAANISIMGSKKSSCRDNDMKMLMRTLPMVWKKLVTVAC